MKHSKTVIPVPYGAWNLFCDRNAVPDGGIPWAGSRQAGWFDRGLCRFVRADYEDKRPGPISLAQQGVLGEGKDIPVQDHTAGSRDCWNGGQAVPRPTYGRNGLPVGHNPVGTRLKAQEELTNRLMATQPAARSAVAYGDTQWAKSRIRVFAPAIM